MKRTDTLCVVSPPPHHRLPVSDSQSGIRVHPDKTLLLFLAPTAVDQSKFFPEIVMKVVSGYKVLDHAPSSIHPVGVREDAPVSSQIVHRQGMPIYWTDQSLRSYISTPTASMSLKEATMATIRTQERYRVNTKRGGVPTRNRHSRFIDPTPPYVIPPRCKRASNLRDSLSIGPGTFSSFRPRALGSANDDGGGSQERDERQRKTDSFDG